MVKCCVEGCRSNSKFSSPDIAYLRLPDQRCFPNLYKKWLHKITGIPEDSTVDFIAQVSSRVCSLHFTEDDFVQKTDRNRTRRTLRVEALPTLRLPLFCRALREETEDPFAVKFPDFVNGNLRIGSPMCNNNNNNDPSSPLKCLMNNNSSRRNNGNDLIITKVAKRIKIEPGAFRPSNEQVRVRHHPRECEISPQNGSFQTPENDPNEEPEANIPACFRGKKNVYSPYAFSIIGLESELGFDVFMINQNKYLKCDPVDGDTQIWRCTIRSCGARVATASTHCSILVGLRGVHYHQPTNGVPVDPTAWAPEAPGTPWPMEAEDDVVHSDGNSWSPDVGRDSGCEQSPVAGEISPWGRQQCKQGDTSPHLQSDSRFGVRDLLGPTISQFQLPTSQQPPTISYPVFSSLDALSKFCGGQVIQGNPFNGSRAEGDGRRVIEHNVVPVNFPRLQDVDASAESNPVIVESRSLSTDEQTEYILPSPASERNSAIGEETSEGSSSEPMSARTEEPSFYELVDVVDVQDIIQKDPLAFEENNHHKPTNNRPPMNQTVVPLKEEDAAFFQTLAPHLNLLSAQDKEIFKEKVTDVISHLCKNGTAPRYNGSPNV